MRFIVNAHKLAAAFQTAINNPPDGYYMHSWTAVIADNNMIYYTIVFEANEYRR